MKAREFVREHVVPAGGVFEKTDGDHHCYRLPNGRRIDVPMGGSQTELAPSVVRRLTRLLADVA